MKPRAVPRLVMWAVLIAAVLLSCACGASQYTWRRVPIPKRSWPPATAVRATPESLWIAEYHKAEQCLGWEGDVSAIEWYLVPGNEFIGANGIPALAAWVAPHQIYVAEGHRRTAWVLRHESLHDLIGKPVHSDQVFGTLCRAMWGYLRTEP